MLLVILGISLVMLAVGIFIYCKFGSDLYSHDREWIYWILNFVGSVVLAITLVAMLCIGGELTGSMVIDDKIALYQRENANIESEISTIVSNYQDYEQGVFDNVKNENPAVLVSLYPELKSDKLVNKQIEIYTANNKKIKKLEEEKLDYKPLAWWLYFGG